MEATRMHERRSPSLRATRNQKAKEVFRRTVPLVAIALCAFVGIPASASAAPPTATTEAATAVRYVEATFKGSVNPEGTATNYWFEYGETASYGNKVPVVPEAIGSGTSNVSVSQLVAGLSESTTYHFRVVAEGGGETVSGEDATFTTTGFDFSFGEPGSGNGQLSGPFGIAVDSKGNVWVSDTGNDRVEEFSEEGKYLSRFGKEGTGNGEFKEPKGIAVDSEGNIWVVDSGNDRAQKFNSKGEYLGKFGEEGPGEGQFKAPSGIALDHIGRPLIVDTGNDRVEKFDKSFKLMGQFGKEGTGNGEFSSPTGVLIDAAGHLWVTDTGNNRVQRFNGESFKYISQFGEKGTGDSKLIGPMGIVDDFQEKLWVIDTGNDRAQKFKIEGEFLDKVGKEGTGPAQLTKPTAVVAPAPQKLLIVDSGNDRVEGWTVKAEPPRTNTNPASDAKTMSVTLHANINPQAFATEYWFEYGTTEAYGAKIPLTPESIGSGLSNVLLEQTLTGLKEGTRYHFRAVAESLAGRSMGIDRSIKTLQLPVAITEAATAIGSTQATLNGTVNPEGSEATYWFEYGTTEAYGTKTPLTPASVGAGTKNVAVSQTPTGLSKGTEYHFRVVATSEAGEVTGGDKTLTTGP